MKHKLAVIGNVYLLLDAQHKIKNLFSENIEFSESNPKDLQEMIKLTDGADMILVSPFVKISTKYLKSNPNLKYIGVCGTSTENIDIHTVNKLGITLTNIKGHGDEPAAEFIFMQLLQLLRGAGKYQWRKDPHELMGKSVTIIGLGKLGQSIANLALAYKMKVYYYSLHQKPAYDKLGLVYGNLSKILPKSDIIILSSTTNKVVLGAKDFSIMQPGKIIVQASVGDVIDNQSFVAWIKQDGNFAIFNGSAGDKNYQRYKDLPGVIFSQTIAGYSFETRQRLGMGVINNIRQYLES